MNSVWTTCMICKRNKNLKIDCESYKLYHKTGFTIHLFCYFWIPLTLLLSCLLGSALQHYSMNYYFTKKRLAIRIINLKSINFHTSPLFKQNSISKFQDKIWLENILFVSKSLIIYGRPFLIQGLVFLHQINITMELQVLRRVIS